MSHRILTHDQRRRLLHGAFLTPWFAVSLGIVIAASLSLATAHPKLYFLPVNGAQCVAGCAHRTHPAKPLGERLRRGAAGLVNRLLGLS
jgi:hypothetical protein